ncbi:MAG TPA: DUF971 domain-containing protein [Janthinobacterium sp.]|jgi:DUF971 family protein|nr:DUF971 domain-containing protein [Janthinobacterium sp.]
MTEFTKSAPVPQPTALTVHKQSRVLDISFDDGAEFSFPFEFLRVYSPSAEVRGHSKGQEVLQVGKRDIDIASIEPVGNYAIQPTFSDGHNSGLYSWAYLHHLGSNQEELWQEYLDQLAAAGYVGDAGRDSGSKGSVKAMSACGHQH